MRRLSAVFVFCVLLAASTWAPHAQQAQQGQQGQQGQGQQGQQGRQGQQQSLEIQPTRPGGPPALQSNIKLDITFIDTLGGDTPTRKTVSILTYGIGPSRQGKIRSSSARGQGYINIDALPTLSAAGDGVYLNLSIEYLPELPADSSVRLGAISQSLTVALPSGKPIVVTQSADPGTSRKVTVEVVATILK